MLVEYLNGGYLIGDYTLLQERVRERGDRKKYVSAWSE